MYDPGAVGAQIRMRLPCLTPSEGRVAADMPARRDITEHTSLREVAERKLLDALFVATAQRHRAAADFNLDRTMSAVQSRRKP